MKFKSGDRIRIINFGSWVLVPNTPEYQDFINRSVVLGTKNDDIIMIDPLPELVGKTGVIKECLYTQGIEKYSIEPDETGVKTAWYTAQQLELIH